MHGVKVHAPPLSPTADRGRQNPLLARLAADDHARLSSHLVVRSFEAGTILQEAGDPILRVYFLHSGTACLVKSLPDGNSLYTAIIGREGALGLLAGLGANLAFSRAIAQSPVTASCIATSQFAAIAANSPGLRTMIARYSEFLLSQTQQTLVCNSAHYLQARLCRWLLHARDSAGSDTLVLTQKFLSKLLGAQRTSVNFTLGTLEVDGLIDIQRGRIHLRDAQALERRACCCYGIVRLASSVAAGG